MNTLLSQNHKRNILNILYEAHSPLDTNTLFTHSEYGKLFNDLRQKYEQQKTHAHLHATMCREEKRIHRNYRRCMYSLEKQECVQRTHTQGKILFTITKRGKEKIKQDTNIKTRHEPYIKKPAHYLTVVIFDVPERLRAKRAWLRCVLRELDFRMIQKSVWVGTNAIPQEFIQDAQYMRVLPYMNFLKAQNITYSTHTNIKSAQSAQQK